MANEILLQLSQQPKRVDMAKQGVQSNKPDTVVSEGKDLNKPRPDTLESGRLSADKRQQKSLNDLQAKVSQLNDYIQSLNRNIEFSIDKKSGESVIIVRDSETKDVIRQIPSEELLDARRAVDKMKGNLIEVKA